MAIVIELLRHGLALPAAPGGDGERPLSPAGERAITRLAERLARTGWQPDRVFSSPLRRALDTARILSRAARVQVRVEMLHELGPEAQPGDVIEALARQGVSGGQVLLVGHMPLLGRLAARLTHHEKAFAPGTLVRIQCPDGLERGTGEEVCTLDPGDV
ncbi:MAG: phosphohistidine phosphatase SixA [Candidatus Eisenbacteria bacterium]|nr:phosphohistidine phosphatase SixA [Candidatus Eisenbacteria bacterium]